MQVLAGSYQRGLVDHHTEPREGQFLEVQISEADESRIVTCPMQPGDVLLMHNLTFHRSLPNLSTSIRWSVDIRYIRDGDPGVPQPDDAGGKWVIHSTTQPVTSREEWLRRSKELEMEY